MTRLELPWLEAWLASAREQVAGRHHAWLVTGRRGDGLGEAGGALAAALLCEQPQAGAACGACDSCRWRAAGAHPDLLHLTVEASDDETLRLPTIKVDQARAAVEFATRSAGSERGRVIWVDPADALTAESANAVLKALEEPAAATRWLLVAERPSRLLPTLRSRALRLVLPRPSRNAATAFLARAGMADPAASEALGVAANAPLTALAWLTAEPELREARERFLRELARPRDLSALAWGQWIEAGGRLGRRARFVALLDWLVLWLVDRQRVAAGAAPRALPPALLAASPSVREPGALLRYYREIERARALPDTTLSARLQAERLLLDFRAVFSV